MEIKSTKFIKTAEYNTQNGHYEIEYTIENKVLNRCQVVVFLPRTTDEASEQIGVITQEGTSLHTSFYTSVPSYSGTITDFETIISMVKEEENL